MDEISHDIRTFLDHVRLGFVATVSKENTPNLSPKGSLMALDKNHLVFANINSPQTIKNLRVNNHIEINAIDPITRKGYRFKGTAEILEEGEEFSKIVSTYRQRGIENNILSVVKIKITEIKEVVSPLYSLGISESDIKNRWKKHFLEID